MCTVSQQQLAQLCFTLSKALQCNAAIVYSVWDGCIMYTRQTS